jgi:hypothetical protein
MYVNLYSVQALIDTHSRNLIPQKFIGIQWVKDYGEYLSSQKYHGMEWKIFDRTKGSNRGQTCVFPEIAAMYLEWLSGVNGWELQSRVHQLIYPTETLYFLQCGNHQKIGVSRKFESRLSSIQSANPFPVDVIKTVQCLDAKRHESHILAKYHLYRVSGEWFKLPFRQISEILNYMESIEDATPTQSTPLSRQLPAVQLGLFAG